MLHARLSRRYGAEAKASLNRATKYVVLDPKPSEPTYPETCADDLWLAVKFQTNSDIAGSPRNRFRPSLE